MSFYIFFQFKPQYNEANKSYPLSTHLVEKVIAIFYISGFFRYLQVRNKKMYKG